MKTSIRVAPVFAGRRRAIYTLPLFATLAFSCADDQSNIIDGSEVGTTNDSLILGNGTLALKVLSVTRGNQPSQSSNQLGLQLVGFNSPPSAVNRKFNNLAGSVDLGNCTGSVGGTCSGLNLPPDQWTRAFQVDTSKPPQTISYAGELYIRPVGGGLGTPTFPRCFHVGLDTSTFKLKNVPVSSAGCNAEGPNDSLGPVTCDATTCTASIRINPNDSTPWKVKLGYTVTAPTIKSRVTYTPDFFVTHVVYAPPGKSSNVSYSASTSLGTTTSTTSSFDTSLKVTASGSGQVLVGGSGNVSVGATWGHSQMDQTDITYDTSTGYKKSGQVDGIDHDYDEIWLMLRPKILADYTQSLNPAVQPSMTWQFATNQQGSPYFVYVGWLKGTMEMPLNVKQVLEANGITSEYYTHLLSADPLADGTFFNPSQDPSRFDFVGEFPFVPPLHGGDMPSSQTYTVSQKTTKSNSTTATNSYTVGLNVALEAGTPKELQLKLAVEASWKWTNSSTMKLSKGTGTNDSLTIGQPLFGYAGPTRIRVYEDTIYRTYVFALEAVCGAGLGAQVCSGANQCVSTVWGFEPGEPWSWGNSAETNSGIVSKPDYPAHSGNRSLQVSAPSDFHYPARVNNWLCGQAPGGGTMNLKGRSISAWVQVANSTSSYAGTSCLLRAFNPSFQESQIYTTAVKAPIVPGAWFQLSGTFPSTATESQIETITVDCNVPANWGFNDPTKVWYVDDIFIN